MEKVIISVHGLANKPVANVLEDWWKRSIKEGLKNIKKTNPLFKFKMVYWANYLYLYPLHSLGEYNFDSHYNTQPYFPAKPGSLKKYDQGILDNFRNWTGNWVGAGLDFFQQFRGVQIISEMALKKAKVFRDLQFYYDNKRKIPEKPRGKKIKIARQVLMGVLKKELKSHSGKRILLIAHSMGSIIAYDVLRDIGREKKKGKAEWKDFECAYFVTIGSPLGLSLVKDRIYSERSYKDKTTKDLKRTRTPTVVTKKWKNYADPRDPVSADAYLSDDFDKNAIGVKVEDDLIYNDYIYGNGEGNPHKSYGYLRTPELSKNILNFLIS